MAAAAPDLRVEAALHEAISEGLYGSAMRLILEQGADVNEAVDADSVVGGLPQRDIWKETPIIATLISIRDFDGESVAVRRTALDAVLEFLKFLLDQGADPNVKSGFEQQFPLEVAVAAIEPEIVILLLDHGADPTRVRCYTDVQGNVRKGSLLDLAESLPSQLRLTAERRAKVREIVEIVRPGQFTKAARKEPMERPLKRARSEASLWLWRNALLASKGNSKQAVQMLARAGFKKPAS